MKLLDKFTQTFGFTPTESKVVLFLALTLVLGAGLKFFKASSSSGPLFDYSSSDSIFAARSRLLSDTNSTLDDEDRLEEQSGISSIQKSETQSATLGLKSINLNSATKDELIRLPGIGEAIAERIILYREENGPFVSIEDLMNIKGIGSKKFERIAPYCTLGK